MQDDELVSLLKHKAYGTGLRAKMAGLYQKLFDKDIIAFIRHDPNVLRIHNGGEEFHKAAEDCVGLMQVCISPAPPNSLLSLILSLLYHS